MFACVCGGGMTGLTVDGGGPAPEAQSVSATNDKTGKAR